jgi:peptidoglycan/xylan/chitin deacetylase (PgdA/CDA1 family)
MALTIVMYHYVRDLALTRYPGIKGLTTNAFRAQLDDFSREYSFVGLEEVLSARQAGRSLPDNAILLTFDDGYSDHYQTVFPLLHDRGISGAFFPVAKPILEGTVLDVNKVHFVLSATEDTRALVKTIMGIVEEYRGTLQLDTGGGTQRRRVSMVQRSCS